MRLWSSERDNRRARPRTLPRSVPSRLGRPGWPGFGQDSLQRKRRIAALVREPEVQTKARANQESKRHEELLNALHGFHAYIFLRDRTMLRANYIVGVWPNSKHSTRLQCRLRPWLSLSNSITSRIYSLRTPRMTFSSGRLEPRPKLPREARSPGIVSKDVQRVPLRQTASPKCLPSVTFSASRQLLYPEP